MPHYKRLKKLEASAQLLEDLRKGAQSGEQGGWITAENMGAFFDGEEDKNKDSFLNGA